MNIKRFVTPILILASLSICVKFALGSTTVGEPFSTNMKRAELIFIGTLVDKQYAPNDVSIGFVTDLTFNVNKLIEGTPNIDNDTVIFCIPGGQGIDPTTGQTVEHWSSMGDHFAHLEVGDQVILFMETNEHIAKWMPRRGGLYPVSDDHCWTVKKKKVDGNDTYLVYFRSNSIEERLKHHFLGIPLPLFIRFVEAARNHPETIDAATNVIHEALIRGLEGGIRPDTRQADAIQQEVVKQINQVLDQLGAGNAQPERK